ncbi:hypothetical protein [Chromohalobacter sp. HP20-39]|uniref:hypothetical protein n=1 Tax=Chromohalobacter sp. HP20-39 TaxID=3079306 RepID=UPI00294B1CF2|nr:hypothetical protein [Chromohalobacter sp. HP20-39]MDV6318778.1 hypothetical protein [Chromohalobacter sp. HP20-39]
MGTVTELTPRRNRRLDNPKSQLGRVYLVMRDAPGWLQLHEIGDAILERFERMDSHAAISARIRELRGHGVTIASREKPGAVGTRPHQYLMMSGSGDDSGGAA